MPARVNKASWRTQNISLGNLLLDSKNPRLGRETFARAPREIIQYLFEHDKAYDIAESIAKRGYFPNEPLLAVKEDGQYVVIEGNRRLAATKALNEPGLLEGTWRSKVERLSRNMPADAALDVLPVTVAPSRRATDKQVAGRHIGTPVLAWQAENRASFILDKLNEGYTNDQLRDELGFSVGDIQYARQTRAIAEMARSLDLPAEVRAKIENPRAKLFTTLQRVVESSSGRQFLMLRPDSDHGITGETSKEEFVKGFKKLVTDIALGRQSSRTLNTNDNIREYFESWDPSERPVKRRGSFIPADVISGHSVASTTAPSSKKSSKDKVKGESLTILPKDLRIRSGNPRLTDIRRELTKLKRKDFPNTGAVLLRVFFELTVLDYLDRTGQLGPLTSTLEAKRGARLPHGVPTLKDLSPEIVKVAKQNLSAGDANRVTKAIHYDRSAPFTIGDLHGFIHSSDIPTERDIHQFWNRVGPVIRFMLDS